MGTTNMLRARRRELGLSIDELGQRANIERSRLSRAERGYIRLNGDELKRLKFHLGLEEEQVIATSLAPVRKESEPPTGGAS
ncbi:helix-turn-helix domain-containing protein [Sorangium sp. So ce128]|uniref:helix-turn-helix domain-containing protein n=1 Tax=Sorangium sp. So ce128 TaxID=3133281 RepID=UPI003F60E82F